MSQGLAGRGPAWKINRVPGLYSYVEVMMPRMHGSNLQMVSTLDQQI